jgi:hypothetical protein
MIKRILEALVSKRSVSRPKAPPRAKKTEHHGPCAASANARFYVRAAKYPGEGRMRMLQRAIWRHLQQTWRGWQQTLASKAEDCNDRRWHI